MIPTRALISVLCTFLLLVLAAGSQAQVIPKQNTNLGVTGEVTALDLGAKTLTVIGPNKDGGMFVTNKDTTILNGDRNVSLADLKEGLARRGQLRQFHWQERRALHHSSRHG